MTNTPTFTDIDSYFFKNNKLVRFSTLDDLPVKEPARSLKRQIHTALRGAMSGYLKVHATATTRELAFAHHYQLPTPPTCKMCGKLTALGQTQWATYCGPKCQYQDPAQINKLKASPRPAKKPKAPKNLDLLNIRVRISTHLADYEFGEAELLLEKAIKDGHIIANSSIHFGILTRIANWRAKAEKRPIRPSRRVKPYDLYVIDRDTALRASGFEIISTGARRSIEEIKHIQCGTVIRKPRLNKNDHSVQCFVCDAPRKETAQWEFMKNLPAHQRNKRLQNRMQLDAFFPEQSLAIEFNGLFWHSAAPKPGGRPDRMHPNYHQDKMLAAKAEGIRLIMVWEDQVKDNQNFDQHLFHLVSPVRAIAARKCVVREIEKANSATFLNEHHRDGNIPCEKAFGLFYNDELVMAATFGKNRFKAGGKELYRLATKKGLRIIGGVSKMIKAYLRQHSGVTLTTYSSASWGWGESYAAAGGTLVGLTKPGYFYFDQLTGRRMHRLALSKGNFEKTTGIAWDPSLNEEQNAIIARKYRIYDCGNWKFIWN